MRINVDECAKLLKDNDNILILTHAHPDGDTLGSGFALCRALMKCGKICSVINADEIPKKYDYLYEDIAPIRFKPNFVVAVDVATTNLLGELEGQYHIDLCIDNHGTNTEYADKLLLEDVPACCEIMYDVVKALDVEIDNRLADCLYTGLTTDTGCFRYASTTAKTYRVAGDLIDLGADNGRINRVMFESKTKTYARLERLALDSMEFFNDDRIAIITITQDMYKQTGSNEQETEAIAPLTRQIEGVEIGITIREKADGTCKASIRTFETVNAATLAKSFGGGGHAQASACRFECDVESAKNQLVEKCGELLK
jgi:phosphoesterase RecJ-like protein